jgi:flagellar motility protein MotE (MotC chaperone)
MLDKIYEFLKPIFPTIALILTAITLYNCVIREFRGEREDFSAKIGELQKAHDEEVKKMLDAQAEERRLHEQNLAKLQQDLDSAMSKHEEKLKEIEKSREEISKRLLEKYKDDPVGLSRELGRVTGMPVFLPNEKK